VPDPLIHLIDDDESSLQSLAGLLRSFGFETRTYASAEVFIESAATDAFIEACAADAPRCIITDIHMPGLSGIELKRWLDAHASAVPVIMVTARSEPRLLHQARASGAVCLLRKPFDAAALLACLRKAEVA
jgi:FixJ family two-component response regulator